MAKRKVIKIDREKCNGCQACLPKCPEGAIQMIDGKATLVSDLFCDGLGACLGYCPQGAISIEERQAEPYDERKVMENIASQGANTIKAHLLHLKEHGQEGYLLQAEEFLREKGINLELPPEVHQAHSCPAAKAVDFTTGQEEVCQQEDQPKAKSQLRHWPIQLRLISPFAPYLNNSDLLIAADCVPFCYADFHRDLLKGKVLVVGCPKFDDLQAYQEKLVEIFKQNSIKSVTYVHMEVPCCSGLIEPIKSAIAAAGKRIPFEDVTIGIRGERR